MSEAAKWRLVGSMSHALYEKGQWTWRDHTGGTCSARVEVLRYPDFLEALIIDKVTHVYGPIPDAPKPPPTLRRFTAKHDQYGSVSGVAIEAWVDSYHIFRWCSHPNKPAVHNCRTSDLSDIQWLDKE